MFKFSSVSKIMAGVTKPKVLVFDLDFTLWPFWVDTHVTPPFRKTSNVASRTGEIEGANQLLELLGWKKFFSHYEIYPGGKVRHITNIQSKFGVEFDDMIFFDDENRNIRDVAGLGVLSILVKNGVTKKVVEDALKQFAKSV